MLPFEDFSDYHEHLEALMYALDRLPDWKVEQSAVSVSPTATWGSNLEDLLPPSESSSVQSAATGADDYVSEVIVTANTNGTSTSYYSFYRFDPDAPSSTMPKRDDGTLGPALVSNDPTPDTPLEWELAIDAYATALKNQIASYQAIDPTIEYGSYIYITADGRVSYTPITPGTPTSVNINLNGVSPSQVVGIVHTHPVAAYFPGDISQQFPSPGGTGPNGEIIGDWGVYDYFKSHNTTHPELLRTYVIAGTVMREYRGDDRDTVTPGAITPIVRRGGPR